MNNAAKHMSWAACITACVFFSSREHWVPLNFTLKISPSSGAYAGSDPARSGAELKALSDAIEATQARGKADAGSAAMASTQPGRPAFGAPGTDPAISPQGGSLASIEDPGVARQVLSTLSELDGVDVFPSGSRPEKVVTIFFDPRCPYCHAAFTALRGKIAARWIPVVVLGEPEVGNRMAGTILASPDRAEALAAMFEKRESPPAPASEAAQAKIAQNMSAFAAIFKAAPSLRPGVPTFFIPRPDGRVAIQVGFESGDEAKVQSLMSGS